MSSSTRADIIHHSSAEEVAGIEYPPWLRDRLEWFQDLKFGLFIHWGIYAQWGCIESWPLVAADTWARPDTLACWTERDKDLARFRKDYWDLNTTFNPRHFAPEVWAAAAKYAGMQYLTFTTKHHDGFCLWDTATTDYKSTAPACPFHSHPRANIVPEVWDAFRAQGFAISCYFSKSDWKRPDYWDPARPAPDRNPNYDTHAEPERWQRFVDFTYAQIEELLSQYGPVDILWLDGGQVRPPDQDIRMDRIAAMGRRHQPGLLIADRTVGGAFENILTPEQKIPAAPLGHPWESCLTMGRGWSFVPNDAYKSTRTLIHMLIDIVAKGGNFLLNIGPSPDGEFAADALRRLREIGDWMAVNGDAIYGTRSIAPYKEGNTCFTRKGDDAYALILAPDDGVMPATLTLAGLQPRPGTAVAMLGVDAPLAWRATPAGADITLPPAPPCAHAWVLKFTPTEP